MYFPPDPSIHGISQARILERVAISFSRDRTDPGIFQTQGSSRPRDRTHASCTGRRILWHWATLLQLTLLPGWFLQPGSRISALADCKGFFNPQVTDLGIASRTAVHVCMLSCLRLFGMDWSPPVSSVHGIFQTRNTGVGCHFLLQGIFLTQG